MKRLGKPELWFLIALLVVTAVGAGLLRRADATRDDSRHLSYARHDWQAVFDALSATCGVGLLTYGFEEDYTPQGRWILTALGLVGALLFVSAVTHALRRTQLSSVEASVPNPLIVGGAFLAVQVLALAVILLVGQLAGSVASASETSWRTIAAFSSLGWAGESGPAQPGAGPASWLLALLAWLGALGWPVWMLAVPALSKRYVRVPTTLTLFGAYIVTLLLAALLIAAFESPRGQIGRGGPDESLSGQPFAKRYARSLVQTTAASGAGIPTEPLGAGDATAGTKVTLSALLLVGGLGGSATGGVQWLLLVSALAGTAAALGWAGGEQRNPEAARWMRAGLAGVMLMLLLAVVIAIGLLLLENWTASRYQPPPTFADALLDACSVVAGGNLTSGVTETVTSRNLHAGIRHAVDLYQYGMAWLMVGMLVGRLLPLVILSRLGSPAPSRG